MLDGPGPDDLLLVARLTGPLLEPQGECQGNGLVPPWDLRGPVGSLGTEGPRAIPRNPLPIKRLPRAGPERAFCGGPGVSGRLIPTRLVNRPVWEKTEPWARKLLVNPLF